MKERKKRNRKRLFALLLTACMLFAGMPETEARASMYEDALEFFNSTGQSDGKHIDVVDGTIYFATSGHMAVGRARSGIKYYHTLGYDVTLTGNGRSLTFSVKRGGSLEEAANKIDGGYEYILYRIPTRKIFDLATLADPSNAPAVLSSSIIKVQMDAIITVRQNGLMGSLEEDGKGGLVEDPRNGEIFHLLNPQHLAAASRLYNNPFDTYTVIRDELENFKLDIMYNIGEGARVNAAGYGTGTFNANGTIVSNMLYENGSIWTRSYKLMQEFPLLGTGASRLNLSKKGYSLPEEKEWTKKDGTPFSAGMTYMPKDISPEAGFGNKGVVLYANWKPNSITIFYNANGGTGTVSPTSTYYDNPDTKLRKNTFERPGFTLKKNEEWNTSPNGTGTSYSSEQLVGNIIDGGEITLYANWIPCVYQITTDKQSGTGGTDVFYQQYGEGFSLNKDGTGMTTSIDIPEKTGYDFMGYFESLYGLGRRIVTESGSITVENTYFKRDRLIYASWTPKKFPVTFDKQGGEYGTDTAVATYNEVFPLADAPIRSGYTFKGYYTEENGNGLQIYNEFMASDSVYTYTTGITLYAHWVDETPPKAMLTVSHDTWTNQKVKLTVEAWDYGSGLSSAVMYRIESDGSLSPVAKAENLDGKNKQTLFFTNEIEGIVRFKLVATDMEGNEAETYQVAYYDITRPQGSIVNSNVSYGNFYFEIDITDINTGN